MAGQRVGYVRVSTVEQNTVRQLDGIELDRVFTDHMSGATRNRPALEDLRRYVRDGDTVVVHSMDRLARNLDDLRALVREFTDAGDRRGVRPRAHDVHGQGLPHAAAHAFASRGRG